MFHFSIYASKKSGYSYSNLSHWLDLDFIQSNLPLTRIIRSGHPLHVMGSLVKNYGMRSSIILETTDETEAAMIIMAWESFILKNGSVNIPSLQEGWAKLDLDHLVELTANTEVVPTARSMSNQNTVDLLKKLGVRIEDSLMDAEYLLSPDFIDQTGIFVDHVSTEIARLQAINAKSKSESRKIKNAITKELEAKSIFKLT